MFEFEIIKQPEFENDSMLISFNSYSIDSLRNYLINDEYYELKDEKFYLKDIISKGFERFIDKKPSLRNLSDYLEGTIYTFSCQKKNGMSYERIIKTIIDMLKVGSRRVYLNMSDRLEDYYNSIDKKIDVSCLTGIHYKENRVSLFFRASDIENELIVDIVTIYDHFLKPVYGLKNNIKIELFASTCQNYSYLNKIKNEIIIN